MPTSWECLKKKSETYFIQNWTYPFICLTSVRKCQYTDSHTDKNSNLFGISVKTSKDHITKDFRKISHPEPKIITSWVSGYIPTHRNSLTLSWPPKGGGSTEAVLLWGCICGVSLQMCPLTQLALIFGSGWDIFLKYSGDIPGMILN